MTEALDFGRATAAELRLSVAWALDAFEGSKFREQLRFAPHGLAMRAHCFVARSHSDVVSSVFVVELPVYWTDPSGARGKLNVPGDSPAVPLGVRRLAGVVALVTPPEHQGLGHASGLLSWVHGWAERDDMVASALFSEIGPEFYERRGYVVVPLPYQRGSLLGTLHGVWPGAERALGRPFSADDLGSVVEAYEATAGRHRLAVARDTGYWGQHLLVSAHAESLRSIGATDRDFVVEREDGRAYLRSRSDEDIFTVLELAWVPGAEEAARGLLREELARAAESGCVRARLYVPPASPLPSEVPWTQAWNETFMVRVLAPGLAGAVGRAAAAPPYIFRPDAF